jgi:hypothetical protein
LEAAKKRGRNVRRHEEEGLKRRGWRGRKKGKVERKWDPGSEKNGKGGSVYDHDGWVSVKDRLRNGAEKVDYDESRDGGDDNEDRVWVKKRGRKKRKVVQNQNLSAEKIDGDKEILGRPRKKTNVANAKGKTLWLCFWLLIFNCGLKRGNDSVPCLNKW